MKKLFVALVVAAMAPLAYGQNAAPATPEASKNPPAAAEGNASAPNGLTAQPQAEQTKMILGDRNCVRETGTHIQRKGCVNATGQAYGETAIDRTGTFNTGEALEKLSPAVQVRPGR